MLGDKRDEAPQKGKKLAPGFNPDLANISYRRVYFLLVSLPVLNLHLLCDTRP